MKRFASDRVAGPDGADGPRGRRRDREPARQQDDRERPEPGRGLQLRHAQARRRVRRRHQPPARDDLRGARQGPPQRGPDRDGPGLRRGRDPGARRQPPHRPTSPDDWGMEGARRRAQGDGPRRPGHDRGRALGRRQHATQILEHLLRSPSGRSSTARTSSARSRSPTAAGPRSARPTGRSSSGWSCSGRSTPSGSST